MRKSALRKFMLKSQMKYSALENKTQTLEKELEASKVEITSLKSTVEKVVK